MGRGITGAVDSMPVYGGAGRKGERGVAGLWQIQAGRKMFSAGWFSIPHPLASLTPFPPSILKETPKGFESKL